MLTTLDSDKSRCFWEKRCSNNCPNRERLNIVILRTMSKNNVPLEKFEAAHSHSQILVFSLGASRQRTYRSRFVVFLLSPHRNTFPCGVPASQARITTKASCGQKPMSICLNLDCPIGPKIEGGTLIVPYVNRKKGHVSPTIARKG